jgi:EpsG family
VIPYLGAYLLYFVVIAVGLRQKRLYPWLILASTPLILLVLLRGVVGVDTPFYAQSADLLRISNSLLFIFEPVFEYFLLTLARHIDNSFTILNIIAVCITILLFLSNPKSEINSRILALGIIPYFYLDMTMNGLRYGLAFAIVMVGSTFIIKGRLKTFIALSLVAGLVQITALLLSGFLYLLINLQWKRLAALFLASVTILILGGDYILSKVTANSQLETQSITAGMAPLLISIVLLGGCYMSGSLRRVLRVQIAILALLVFLAYLLTQITYAGLRLQQLILLLIYLYLIYAIDSLSIKTSKTFIATLIACCILSSSFRLKNFYNDSGLGDAPFAPYKFFWNETN